MNQQRSAKVLVASSLALLLLGCSDDRNQLLGGDAGREATSMDGAMERSILPVKHRAVATPCGSAVPPPTSCHAMGIGVPRSNCVQGSDCAAGVNGRCLVQTFLPASDIACACAYDDCASDSDCPATSLCQCAADTPQALGNHCVGSNCRTDADCGEEGFCSPSRAELSIYLNASSPDSFAGYYCHTSADTCVNDADCTVGAYGAHCAFDHAKLAWGCFSYWTY